MPSFAVRNFGCRVNQAETFAWAEEFRGRGLRLDEDWGRSDVVIVNSCALTGRAERDVRKFIRSVHRGNAAARIVVTGCYAERAPGEIAVLPGVAAVLPQSAKDALADRLLAIGAAHGSAHRASDGLSDPRLAPDPAPRTEPAVTPPVAAGVLGDGVEPPFRARGWLKIQDGCDNRCAYCIIPSVRGASRSVPTADVARKVRELAGRGFREVVLAGIHLSSYGEDLEPRASLPVLLARLAEMSGPARLRLSSLDPRKIDRALMGQVASDPRICPHFHFSFQHASTRVLEMMGRPVEQGSYEGILRDASLLAPDAALGADLLVGFPGETETDLDEMRAFVEQSPLTYAHVFSYSPRPGTPAAKRRQVPSAVITERAKALRRLAALKDFGFRRRFIGRELEAVVIGRRKDGLEVLTGNFITVLVPAGIAPDRDLVRVEIRRVLPRRTEGEIVR